jgi:RNA polymerase sigma factor (sigma-70 family)
MNIELMRHAKPELPTEQVAILVRRAQQGDKNAETKMVEHNLGLVAFYANRYRNEAVSVEDRMQAGVIGLIAAIRAFDPSLGNKFSTYATPKIRQAIRRLIHDTAHLIRVPVRQQDGQADMTEAACDALNVGSLNVPVGEDGAAELLELVGDTDHAFGDVDFREALAGLTSREADVLTSRYLLGETLQEVADRLPGRKEGTTMTRARVKQIEDAALAKLREAQVA